MVVELLDEPEVQDGTTSPEVETWEDDIEDLDDEDTPAGDETDSEEEPGESKDTEADADSRESDENAEKDTKGTENDDSGAEDSLRERAEQVGLTPEEVETLGDGLKVAVGVLESKQTVVDEIPESTSEKNEPEGEEETPFELEMSEDDFDPELVSAVKGVHEHHEKRYARLEAEVKTLREGNVRREQQAFEARFDDRIDSLGDDYAETLGTGSGIELDAGSSQMKMRVEIIEEMTSIQSRQMKAGRSALPEQQLFKQAVNRVCPDVKKESARKEIADKLKRRKGSMLNKPQSGEENLTPTQRAKRSLAAKMEAMGGSRDDWDVDEDEEDEFVG